MGLIAAAGLAAYANSFHGPFLFDDLAHIVDNERIRDPASPGRLLSGRRPVVDATLAVNYALGGLDDVRGYHAVNLAIHVAAALALFGLIRRTLDTVTAPMWQGTRAHRLALATALIWVVHPLLTQSVTYVIQRSESLMALFYLLTLYAVNRASRSRRSGGWMGVSVVACALSMGTKAVMVTAPAVALLYDRAFLSNSFSEALRRRWMLYLGLGGTWIVLWLCGVVTGVLDPGRTTATVGLGYQGIDPLSYLLTQPGVVLRYLTLSVWPAALCLDHARPVMQSLLAAAPALGVVAIMSGVVMVTARRNPPLAFVAAWFFLILLPTSSFIPIKDVLFEHRAYLSSAGVVLLGVLGGSRFLDYLRGRLGMHGGLAACLSGLLVASSVVALGWATHRRNETYRSAATMWRDVTRKQPLNARAFENLGTALVMEGRFPDAIAAFASALRIKPGFVGARANLGNALFQSGQIPEAYEQYVAVLQEQPDNADIRVNLGHALRIMGRTEESLAAYRMAAGVSPERASPRTRAGAYFNLGSGLASQGRLDEALEAIREAVRIWPDYEKGHYGLGRILLTQGRIDEAMVHLKQALLLNPRNAEARQAMDDAIARQR